jgi:hypothetical protein
MPGKLSVKFFEYLYHSYVYYKFHEAQIPDAEFDELCKHLLLHWDAVCHPNKGLITKEDLVAGTGYAIQYPRGLERYILEVYENGYENTRIQTREKLPGEHVEDRA